MTVVRTNLMNWVSTYDDNSVAADGTVCLKDIKQVINEDVKRGNGVVNHPDVKALRLPKDSKII